MCYKFVKIMKKVTLKTLAEATAQEVFDQVVKQLLEQGKRSHSLRDKQDPERGYYCMYRGDGGTMCAAGCLIAEDEYKDWLEENSWRQLVDKGHVPETHENLITALQGVHDGKEPSTWREGLLEISKRFDLNPQIITP
jgi:hypothetical protein